MEAGKSVWCVGYVVGLGKLGPAGEGLECQTEWTLWM